MQRGGILLFDKLIRLFGRLLLNLLLRQPYNTLDQLIETVSYHFSHSRINFYI